MSNSPNTPGGGTDKLQRLFFSSRAAPGALELKATSPASSTGPGACYSPGTGAFASTPSSGGTKLQNLFAMSPSGLNPPAPKSITLTTPSSEESPESGDKLKSLLGGGMSMKTGAQATMSTFLGKVGSSKFDLNTSITVNVSGKTFEILNYQLMMIPFSLLASPEREEYMDQETGHYFFDRNSQAFEMVIECYQNKGKVRCPEYLCARLLGSEFSFFRIQDEDTSSEEEDSEDEVSYQETTLDRMDDFLNDPASSNPAKVWMALDLILIFLSMVHFTLDTRQEHEETLLQGGVELFCELINIVSVGFFTMDLILRFIVYPDKREFMKLIPTWFDIIAIMPFYMNGTMEYFGIDPLKFKIFQLFRIFRVARVLKVIKRSRRLLVIGMILFECINELAMLFVFWSLGVFFSGSLMYFCETGQQDSKFTSILASCWWSVVTMSSVGYGDMYPQSSVGKVLGAGIIFLSTVFMAVPMTIIVTKFGECYEKMKDVGALPNNVKRRELRRQHPSESGSGCCVRCAGKRCCCF